MSRTIRIAILSFLILFITACGSSSKSSAQDMKDSTRETQSTDENTLVSKTNLTLNGDKNVTITMGDDFVDPGAVAIDSKDGNITSSIKVKSDLNSSKEGIYAIRYSITNSDGKISEIVRRVTVKKVDSPFGVTPIDSNIEFGLEPGVLYYADPRPEEHGKNRVIRVDYNNMSFEAIPVNGINPHSIDRAGLSDKFYVRTQNSNSFDVVNFKRDEVKTVDLNDHKPRAIGAYNKKYNIQLLSGKDMPVVDVINVSSDRVIETLGERSHYNKSEITSNAGSGSATGHALWFDEDHLGLIDRVNRVIKVYKVNKDMDGKLSFQETSSVYTGSALHALERDRDPKTKKDLFTFYAMGEGDLTKNYSPFVLELTFDPKSGVLSRSTDENGEDKIAWLSDSLEVVDNVKPTTHHGGVTPDGKYFIAPVLDGKVYIIDRSNMEVVKVIDAELGAAHVEFSASRNLALITNHFSNYLTIIDLNTLEKKKTLQIGFNQEFNPNEKHLFQPHFSYVSPDGKYYYTFATQDGEFLKIDLDTLEIVDRLFVDGAPEQAHS